MGHWNRRSEEDGGFSRKGPAGQLQETAHAVQPCCLVLFASMAWDLELGTQRGGCAVPLVLEWGLYSSVHMSL